MECWVNPDKSSTPILQHSNFTIEILSFPCVLLFVLCVSVEAQQPKKATRIGYLSSVDHTRDSLRSEAIRQALRELGYIEGQNIAIEYRYSDGKIDQFSELAAELVRLKVDMILIIGGARYVQAAKNATQTVPIVMTGGGIDPVEAGVVESLARPGGNVTGITLLTEKSAGSGWSCSKRPSARLPVSQFFMIRLRARHGRCKRISRLRRTRWG